MPFAVFRRHQRKLLAIFAILAMFGFVLADSLPSFVGKTRGGAGSDPVLARLYGRDVRDSDFQGLRESRMRANQFVYQIPIDARNPNPQYFGGYTSGDMVTAYILQHEADRLHLPVSADLAYQWIKQKTGGMYNAAYLDGVYRRCGFADKGITEDQVLLDIAQQLRLQTVLTLPMGVPPYASETTPLDVYQTYRDQTEKVSAFFVDFPVENYFDKVGEPTEAEVRELFEASRSAIPDPDRPTPGFMIPRKVKFEAVSADVLAVAATIRPKLMAKDQEKELREIYEARRAEFPAPPGELPLSLFANAPDLTPYDAFPDVKPRLVEVISEERAREEINAKFEDIKSNVMSTFENEYYTKADEMKDSGKSADLPSPGDLLKKAAAKAGVTYESYPPVSRSDVETLGAIARSRLGTTPLAASLSFPEIAFNPRTGLYISQELTDPSDVRFLAWKVADTPARTPDLDSVRTQVVRAWKVAKARPLAEADAKAFADKVSKAGGGDKIKAVAGDRTVQSTEPRSKFGGAMPMEVAEIPHAGEELHDAIFALDPKSATVAHNAPETHFYVLSLRDREPTKIDQLYSFGLANYMLGEVGTVTARKRFRTWITTLQQRAGLPPDWTPPKEGKAEADDLE